MVTGIPPYVRSCKLSSPLQDCTLDDIFSATKTHAAALDTPLKFLH